MFGLTDMPLYQVLLSRLGNDLEAFGDGCVGTKTLPRRRLTLLSQFAFNVGLYYAIPGYYPAQAVVAPLHQRALRLVGNHYLLSFGMYWMPPGPRIQDVPTFL